METCINYGPRDGLEDLLGDEKIERPEDLPGLFHEGKIKY